MIVPAAFALLCLCTQVPSCKLGYLLASVSKDRQRVCRDKIAERLDVGRWVFLVVVIIDFVGLALAMMMRNMGDNPYRYTQPCDTLPYKAATLAPPASCLVANCWNMGFMATACLSKALPKSSRPVMTMFAICR